MLISSFDKTIHTCKIVRIVLVYIYLMIICFSYFNQCVCGTVSSIMSELETRSLGLNTLGTT